MDIRRVLSSLFGFSLLVFSTATIASTRLSESSHEIYLGDVTGDGVIDYVFSPIEKMIFIHSSVDIVFPFKPKDGFYLDGIDGSIVSYQITEAQKNSFELANFDFYSGDFDGDGARDLLVHSRDVVNDSYIVFGNRGSSTPTQSQVFDYLSNEELSTVTFTVSDLNSDGIDDLRVNGAGGDRYYLLATGSGFREEAENYASIGLGTPNGATIVPGATQVDVDVSASGAATLSIPVTLPKGTGGLTPDISLVYSSNGSNGLMGMGWGIEGLSSISRCEKSIAWDGVNRSVRYDNQDALCLDGERLVRVSGTHMASGAEYRTRMESDARIKILSAGSKGPASFRVWKKSGEIVDYGTNSDARLRVGTSGAYFQWNISTVTDRSDNYYRYNYQNNFSTGEHYIASVDYSGNATAGVAPTHSVEFDYIQRPDVGVSYAGGHQRKQTKLLQRVSVQYGGQSVRDYLLKYDQSTILKTPKLIRVQECVGLSTCFAASDIDWHDEAQSFTEAFGPKSVMPTLQSFEGETNWSNNQNSTQVADINSDGVPEIVGFKKDGLHIGRKGSFGQYLIEKPQWSDSIIKRFSDQEVSGSKTYRPIRRQFIDLNNDGLLDIFAQYYYLDASNTPIRKIFASYNRGGSFGPIKHFNDDFGNGNGLFLPGDINNDGLIDLVKVMHHDGKAGNINTNEYYLGITPFFQDSSGNFSTHITWSPIYGMPGFPIYIQWNLSKSEFKDMAENPVYLQDINDDGHLDLAVFQNSKVSVAYGDGLNFGNMHSVGLQGYQDDTMTPNVEYPFSATQGQLADLNSDGHVDFVGFKNDGVYVSLNNGNGYTPQARWSSSFGSSSWDKEKDLRVITDINGDGYADVVGANTSGIEAALGNGRQFVDVPGKLLSANFSGWNSQKHSRIFTDINGDSFADFIGFGANSVVSYALDLEPGKISQVTGGLGSVTRLEYAPLTDAAVYQMDPQSYSGDKLSYRGPYYVVKAVEQSDGRKGFIERTYNYKGMWVHKWGLGSLGFREYSVHEPATDTTTTYKYSQDYSNLLQKLPISQTTVRGSGSVGAAQSVTKTFDWTADVISGSLGSSNLRYRVRKESESTVTRVRDSGSTFKDITREETSYSSYDSYGNVGKIVTSVTDEFGTLTKTNTNSYSNNASDWILGRLKRSVVESKFTPSASPHAAHLTTQADKRVASFTYYSGTGYLHTETNEPDSANWIRKTYQYNQFGQQTETQTDWSASAYPGLEFTSTRSVDEFESTGRFIARSFTPIAPGETSFASSRHRSETQYYLDRGLPRTKTDSNGNSVVYEYDAFGRVTKKTNPDGTWTTTSREFCGSECPEFAVRKTIVQGSDGSRKVSFMDRFNRVVEERSISLNGLEIAVRKQYDNLGRVVALSEPFFASEGPQHWIETDYDNLGRVIHVTSDFIAAGESTPTAVTKSISYDGLSTTETNELGQNKTTWRNAQEQVVKVTDDAGNAVLHRYDVNGNLLTTKDSAGNTTLISYDNFGRKKTLDDPDKGHWEYQYNSLGLLYRQTDAKGQVTQTTYDPLGRKVERIDNAQLAAGAADLKVTQWTYDVGHIGSIQSVADGHFTESYSYDAYGRVTDINTQIGTESYTSQNTYDSLGRLATKTYPEGFAVDYVYNQYGFLEKLEDHAKDLTYWQAELMDEHGNIAQYSVQSGVMLVNRIHDEVRGILRKAEVNTITGERLQDLSFEYDALSNLRNREDAIASVREEFDYDNINRLTLADTFRDVGEGMDLINSVTVSYDALGNITSKSDVGTYSIYGGVCDGVTAGPHAISRIDGQKAASYCYDANGNMVSGAGRTIEYTSFDKPSVITKGDNRVELIYGPARNRVQRTDVTAGATTTTTYVGGSYERVASGGRIKHKFYVGDSAIVTREAGKADTIHYLFKDHLGSISTVVDETGEVVERRHFDPWGNRLAGDWVSASNDNDWYGLGTITTKGFTGHEQLASVGLIHMNGRVYDPTIGRFIQADPMVQAPNDLQSLNRYSYVRNNPLSLTDPSGYSWFSKAWDSVKKFVKKWWRPIVAIAIMAVAPYAAPFIGGQFAAYTAAGFAAGYVSTGTLKGAIVGGISGALFYGIGEAFHGLGKLSVAEKMAKTWMHGMVGAARSAALGGEATAGFVSAGFTQAVSVSEGFEAIGIDSGPNGNMFANAAAAAVVGGTASELAGGKFSNGAVTGAFSRMFNDVAHNMMEPSIGGFIREEGLNVLLRAGQAVGGAGQALLGGAICYGSGGLACALGATIAAKGIDNFQAGIRGTESVSQQLLVSATGNEQAGTLINAGLDLGTSVGGLLRSVPKVDALGVTSRSWWARDHMDYEPAFRQATRGALMIEGTTATTTVIDAID